MNTQVTKTFLTQLEDDTGINSIFVDADRDLYDYDVLNIHKELYSLKTYKLPKNLTQEWVIKKVNAYLQAKDNSAYTNLSNTFNKILKKGLQFYPTTYGLGTFTIFDTREALDAKLKPIEDILIQNHIEYTKEFSDALFVYRIKISKKEVNLKRIRDLKI